MLGDVVRSADLSDRPEFGGLTARQQQCLSLAADNLTSKEIAHRLGVSRHTVDQSFRRSIRVLRVRNRREAARLFKGQARGPVPRDALCAQPARVIPLPFSTAERPRNTMSLGWRLGWIAALAALSTTGGIMYLAGLESLSRMLR